MQQQKEILDRQTGEPLPLPKSNRSDNRQGQRGGGGGGGGGGHHHRDSHQGHNRAPLMQQEPMAKDFNKSSSYSDNVDSRGGGYGKDYNYYPPQDKRQRMDNYGAMEGELHSVWKPSVGHVQAYVKGHIGGSNCTKGAHWGE